MNTTDNFNVTGDGTEKQKKAHETIRLEQDERYRVYKIEQIKDPSEKLAMVAMIEQRDTQLEEKQGLGMEAIERTIAAKQMQASQPTIEHVPDTQGGRTISRKERSDAIRNETLLLMEPQLEMECKEFNKSENEKIDQAIDAVLDRQQEQEQKQSEGLSEAFDQSFHR